MLGRKCRGFWSRRAIVVVGLAATLLALAACGSDAGAGGGGASPEEAFQKVMPSDCTYTVDDLFGTGFKKSKRYNVDELPEAVDALSGFWGPDPYNRKDFEVRFYESHEDAVEYGAVPADEASGEDAKLDEETATWKEGIKDRKRMASGGSDDLAAWSGSVKPKYGDYSIFANMVILCEGLNPAEALKTCASLVAALQTPNREK